MLLTTWLKAKRAQLREESKKAKAIQQQKTAQHSPEEIERALRLWLKRKKIETRKNNKTRTRSQIEDDLQFQNKEKMLNSWFFGRIICHFFV